MWVHLKNHITSYHLKATFVDFVANLLITKLISIILHVDTYIYGVCVLILG